MLFGIAGRKQTGKSTVSSILLDRGFKVASFAAALKEYLCKLYSWSMEDITSQEGKESSLDQPVVWNEDKCKELSDIINSNILFEGDDKVFYTRRESLLYIGTEVLRKHDPQFHIKEFKKRFSDGDYVCDDLRFPNEHELLKRMGATSVFIIRPHHNIYNNHDSEISLHHSMFKHIYVNEHSVDYMKNRFNDFFDYCIDGKPTFDWNYHTEVKYNENLVINNYINMTKFPYEARDSEFAFINVNSCYMAGRYANCDINNRSLIGEGNYTLADLSVYVIDDLKKWNIDSRNLHLPPTTLKDEKDQLHWLRGYIEYNCFTNPNDQGLYIKSPNDHMTQYLCDLIKCKMPEEMIRLSIVQACSLNLRLKSKIVETKLNNIASRIY